MIGTARVTTINVSCASREQHENVLVINLIIKHSSVIGVTTVH